MLNNFKKNIMKKIFTSLAAIAVISQSFAQVITQNATPNSVSATGSVACSSSNQTTGVTFYSADNSYTRLFKLSDYGINYDYKITNVAFGVQKASMPLDVTVRLYKPEGNYPAGTLTELGTAIVNVTTANEKGMVNTGTTLTQIIPAGTSFVAEVFHDGTDSYQGDGVPTEIFYMGTNAGGQTGASYLSSDTCGLTAPIATGTGALANFATAKWVMTITGENNLGVTEVINSRNLQIYPNPVKDVLNFKLANGLKTESIEIYDMAGKQVNLVSSKLVESVNVTKLSKGNYILKVKANDGKVYIQKLIKD